MTQKTTNRHPWSDGTPYQQLRLKFLRARAQARHRQEQWELSWSDWCEAHDGAPELHDRSRQALNLTRRDNRTAWHRDNLIWLPRQRCMHRQSHTITKEDNEQSGDTEHK